MMATPTRAPHGGFIGRPLKLAGDMRSSIHRLDRAHEDGAVLRRLRHADAQLRQRHRVFDSIAMDPETFHGRGDNRLKQIAYLLKTGQVDERLFWKES
ncbi:MAG: hypothetical protein ACRD3S_03325 [Terracidiphilus sp.]